MNRILLVTGVGMEARRGDCQCHFSESITHFYSLRVDKDYLFII